MRFSEEDLISIRAYLNKIFEEINDVETTFTMTENEVDTMLIEPMKDVKNETKCILHTELDFQGNETVAGLRFSILEEKSSDLEWNSLPVLFTEEDGVKILETEFLVSEIIKEYKNYLVNTPS